MTLDAMCGGAGMGRTQGGKATLFLILLTAGFFMAPVDCSFPCTYDVECQYSLTSLDPEP